MDVDAAGISVKAGAHYPGRPRCLPLATAVVRRRDGQRGVSRGHSTAMVMREGLNRMMRKESVTVQSNYIAEVHAEVWSRAGGYWTESKRVRRVHWFVMGNG